MIYQFTGQPGHGKTLHAIDKAIDFRNEGRLVYVCNVRDFDHVKAKMLPLSPEGFKDWESLPDGSVILVDECYEHGMLPKRPPGSKVPRHVEQLAKHRHRGFDFIFVTQSPSKQMDEFVHDLIERHVHVRRRFGLPYVHLRTFDKYERHPEKGHPLVIGRGGLPKRPMGLYVSTELDTTEKKVPWYYPLAVVLALGILAGATYTFFNISGALSPQEKTPASASGEHGAPATGERLASGLGMTAEEKPPLTTEEYLGQLQPRVPELPFSMPAFDSRKAISEPAVYCMSTADSCSCLTEQGTKYLMSRKACSSIALNGPAYNPFKAAEQVQKSPAPAAVPTTSSLAEVGAGGPSGSRADPAHVGPKSEAMSQVGPPSKGG